MHLDKDNDWKIEDGEIEKLKRFSKQSKYFGIILMPLIFLALGYTTISLKNAYKEHKELLTQNEKIKSEILLNQATKDSLRSDVESLISQKNALSKELTARFGLDLKALDEDQVEGAIDLSLRANEALNKLSEKVNINQNLIVKRIVVELEAAGIEYRDREPSRKMSKRQTNAMWFGSDVSLADVKYVALTLIRAGVKIQGIRPYSTSSTNPAYKRNIIEIGASVDVENEPAYTIEGILDSDGFTR
jgi:hypothetical protein